MTGFAERMQEARARVYVVGSPARIVGETPEGFPLVRLWNPYTVDFSMIPSNRHVITPRTEYVEWLDKDTLTSR